MSQTSLGTCRWINKAHSSTGMYFCSTRGTDIAKIEGQWPPSIWPNHSVPETQPAGSYTLSFYILSPDAWAEWLWHHQMLSESSALPFQWEKHCACAGELLWFACTFTGIPANYFLPLCKNPVVFSITQISSLLHSLPGILVCPHTRASNLLIEHDICSQKIDM